MKNKLFIFLTSDKWSYCSGAIVVISPNFQEIKEIIKKEVGYFDQKLYKNEQDVPKDSFYNCWVLKEVFEVDSEPRLVCFDYNWA